MFTALILLERRGGIKANVYTYRMVRQGPILSLSLQAIDKPDLPVLDDEQICGLANQDFSFASGHVG